MTTQEIKNLIASKIAGQGSAVDAGSALPDILNGIVEILDTIPEPAPDIKTCLVIKNFSSLPKSDVSIEEMASAMEVSASDLRKLLRGEIPTIRERGSYIFARVLPEADLESGYILNIGFLYAYDIVTDGAVSYSSFMLKYNVNTEKIAVYEF